ncbi:MAG: hypothetical protein ABS944_10105 [Solibacillus sp.]
MKIKKIIQTAIKYGPILYPIIKKVIDKKSVAKSPSTPRMPRR